MCVIDCETTGTQAGFHDLIQICILPLDSELKPFMEIVPPFYCELKPRRPDNCSEEHTKINRLRLCKVMQDGLDPDMAADLFADWFKKFNLVPGKRIMPIAQNWPFDRAFAIDWLGPLNFDYHFDARYRDTMVAALFLNDRADMQVEQIPFPKVDLAYLASCTKVIQDRKHDALADCVTTAEVYRQMVKSGM